MIQQKGCLRPHLGHVSALLVSLLPSSERTRQDNNLPHANTQSKCCYTATQELRSGNYKHWILTIFIHQQANRSQLLLKLVWTPIAFIHLSRGDKTHQTAVSKPACQIANVCTVMQVQTTWHSKSADGSTVHTIWLAVMWSFILTIIATGGHTLHNSSTVQSPWQHWLYKQTTTGHKNTQYNIVKYTK